MKSNQSNRKNAIVYIDGYNWYYGIFKERPDWKWLNLEGFFDELRRHDKISAIKLFTALVDEAPNGKRNRHQLYLNALSTLDRVQVIKGKFQMRDAECPHCARKYLVPEEKQTDTNIAVHIMEDSLDSKADLQIVVSADSDLHPAIAWAKRRNPSAAIMVYVPVLEELRPYRRTDGLNHIGVETKFLPLDTMSKHQFPDEVPFGGRGLSVKRPSSWV